MERSRTDHYRVLQVDPSANPLVIQAAYRVLARIFHPDVEGDDEQMKRLNRAWEVLGDPRRRAAYDIELAGRNPRSGDPAARPPVATSPAAAPARAGAHAGGSRTADVHAAFAARSAARSAAVPPPATQPIAGAGPVAAREVEHPGPPPGEPYGSVIRFGRYAGWSLGQVGRVDRPYLEWLRGVPAGRGLRDEIDAVIRSAGIQGVDRRRFESERQRVHSWAPGAPTRVD